MNGIYNITVYLPESSDWYFYNTKELMYGSSENQFVVIGDDQFGTFVKAGSIIPILNYDSDRLSILHAIDDDIRIEVYPDTTSEQASGSLYLDDYESHQYRSGIYTLVAYAWDGSVLSVTKQVEDAYYFKASGKMINEVTIMNVVTCPTAVINRWVNNTPYPAQGNVPASFVYLPSTMMLHIFDLNIPVDDGLSFGVAQELIEVVY